MWGLFLTSGPVGASGNASDGGPADALPVVLPFIDVPVVVLLAAGTAHYGPWRGFTLVIDGGISCCPNCEAIGVERCLAGLNRSSVSGGGKLGLIANTWKRDRAAF